MPSLPEFGIKVVGAMIAALFVRRDSIYKSIPSIDAYDMDRRAETFRGGCPVIAHPPCRTWSKLKAFARAPVGEHNLALFAVDLVRENGGVVEHPATSSLWSVSGMPLLGGLPDKWGGWVFECDQFHWGHLAQKRTRLYICGTFFLPPIPHKDGIPSHCVSSLTGKRRSVAERRSLPHYKPELGPNRRDRTPLEFALWLKEICESISCGADGRKARTDPGVYRFKEEDIILFNRFGVHKDNNSRREP